MPGKKWCEYCRINLPYNKKAIDEHESTRQHIHNKQKHIKFERIKIQRAQKAAKEALKNNSLISTANVPKAKKGSELEQQVEQYRCDVITSGKMAIHQLIAEKTNGLYGAPIEYPAKEDLVLAENYQDEGGDNDGQEGSFQMWKIDVCEETGKACFINRVTQANVYEPPTGYIMSDSQKQEWEETKKLCDEIPEDDGEQKGEAGEWQQVEGQDYFAANRASQSEEEENPEPLATKKPTTQNHNIPKPEQQKTEKGGPPLNQKTWMDELHTKIQRNELNESQVIGTMLSATLDQCRSVKQKNEVFKKLIKNDFSIRTTTIDQTYSDLKCYEEKGEENNQKKIIGIKPRKKVKVCQLIQDQDIV